jgi:hypothetical protein
MSKLTAPTPAVQTTYGDRIASILLAGTDEEWAAAMRDCRAALGHGPAHNEDPTDYTPEDGPDDESRAWWVAQDEAATEADMLAIEAVLNGNACFIDEVDTFHYDPTDCDDDQPLDSLPGWCEAVEATEFGVRFPWHD